MRLAKVMTVDDEDYALSIVNALPARWPRTPAGRLQIVADLLHPIDPETGEELEPLISWEDAIGLLETED